nr:integrase arm-type DNA-binding domain-containing protein [Proteus columbae]
MKYHFVGKEKILSIGVYPQVTLAEARNQRDDAKKLLVQHKDPSEQKQLARLEKHLASKSTFEAVAREWHTSKKDHWLLCYH